MGAIPTGGESLLCPSAVPVERHRTEPTRWGELRASSRCTRGRLLLGPRPSPPPNSAGNRDLIYSTYQLVKGMGGNTHPSSIPALFGSITITLPPKMVHMGLHCGMFNSTQVSHMSRRLEIGGSSRMLCYAELSDLPRLQDRASSLCEDTRICHTPPPCYSASQST